MRSETNPSYLLRGVLAAVGAVIVFLGINVGFGGIQTLGWQDGGANFLTVTDGPIYAVHDNHIRFIGGVWLALGLLMLAGSFAFRQLRIILVAFTFMIFVGGIARLSGGSLSLLTSSDIAPSLLFEVIIAPLLGWWFTKAERA